jgi:hypothetical protein
LSYLVARPRHFLSRLNAPYNALKVHCSATLGEEPEMEVELV